VKYRSDFVTNSSSSSFVFNLILEDDSQHDVAVRFKCNPDWSSDDTVPCERAFLCPVLIGDTLSIEGVPLSAFDTVADLSKFLFDNVIFEFHEYFSNEPPEFIQNNGFLDKLCDSFLDRVRSSGLTMKSLSKIVIRSYYKGSGSSRMVVPFDNYMLFECSPGIPTGWHGNRATYDELCKRWADYFMSAPLLQVNDYNSNECLEIHCGCRSYEDALIVAKLYLAWGNSRCTNKFLSDLDLVYVHETTLDLKNRDIDFCEDYQFLIPDDYESFFVNDKAFNF
jgi:hypothetical protein